MNVSTSRRSLLKNTALASFAAAAGAQLIRPALAAGPDAKTLGESGVQTAARPNKVWKQISDRKIRVGVVGHGLCQFGAAFSYQDHPNVAVAAVSDLIKDRCDDMSKKMRCEKTYPSLEEMLKDDTIEAIYLATDAPSHAQQAIDALGRGKHLVTAVPAVFGSLEDADRLYEAVKKSGKKYMMNETSAYRQDCCAMRAIYRAGGFGKLIYTEGEYFHYMGKPLPSYKEWRVGIPPQLYPTHSNAYYHCVTGGTFTELSCRGMPSILADFKPDKNRYKNPFATEVALARTSEGGMARMAVSWDTEGPEAEAGRLRGERGGYDNNKYTGELKNMPDLEPPALPPNVKPGGHGGSHSHLTEEFVSCILEDRQPLVDISMALNMTVAGVVAHASAMKDGETMKVPQYAALKA